LRTRPQDEVSERCFEWREGPVPTPGPGEALVRVLWLAIEPTQRTWLNAHATYTPPVALGEVMRGAGVGQVIASRTERLAWSAIRRKGAGCNQMATGAIVGSSSHPGRHVRRSACR
jgi:NADPH-dependent curcumin reductase CurA